MVKIGYVSLHNKQDYKSKTTGRIYSEKHMFR